MIYIVITVVKKFNTTETTIFHKWTQINIAKNLEY